ncbi:MAG: site-2 protease family protein [Pseudomonadota bacterium]
MFNDNNPIFEFRGPFGVPIQIGASLVLLLGFYFYTGGTDVTWTATFIALLFVSIFLHELGHAWGCLIQGIPVRRIMLYGGGGFCEHARSASAYEQELIVAMGPIVNIVLWAVFSLISNVMWDSIFAQASAYENPEILFNSPQATIAEVLGLFAYINGFLAIFNLIPVQPLDGGKLFHLGLLRLLRQDYAMVITGAVGLVLSVIWIPAMLIAFGLGWWILFFIPSIPLHWSMMRQRLA